MEVLELIIGIYLLIIAFFHAMAIIAPIKLDDPRVVEAMKRNEKSIPKYQKINAMNNKWRDIGPIYRVITPTAQSIVVGVVFLLSYFTLLNEFLVYGTMAALFASGIFLSLARPSILSKLSPEEENDKKIKRFIRLGILVGFIYPILLYTWTFSI